MLRAPVTVSPPMSPLSAEAATVSVIVPAVPDNVAVVGTDPLTEALAEYVCFFDPRSWTVALSVATPVRELAFPILRSTVPTVKSPSVT